MTNDDVLGQLKLIKETFRDHQRTVPLPPEKMYLWAAISAFLIYGTPYVLTNYGGNFLIIGLFYLLPFLTGIFVESLLIRRENTKSGIYLSPTQRYILSIHLIGLVFGVLLTVLLLQYGAVEPLYLFWTFWIGLGTYIVGFLTRPFIYRTGLTMMLVGTAGILLLIFLKSGGLTPAFSEKFLAFTQHLSFVFISLSHLWMGLRLRKESHA